MSTPILGFSRFVPVFPHLCPPSWGRIPAIFRILCGIAIVLPQDVVVLMQRVRLWARRTSGSRGATGWPAPGDLTLRVISQGVRGRGATPLLRRGRCGGGIAEGGTAFVGGPSHGASKKLGSPITPEGWPALAGGLAHPFHHPSRRGWGGWPILSIILTLEVAPPLSLSGLERQGGGVPPRSSILFGHALGT